MPSHYSGLRSSTRRSARLLEGAIERFVRAASMTLPLLASLTVAACGGEEDTGVTYEDDVEPIFFQRCTTCHHAGSPIKVDIENPYKIDPNPDNPQGLVYSENSW